MSLPVVGWLDYGLANAERSFVLAGSRTSWILPCCHSRGAIRRLCSPRASLALALSLAGGCNWPARESSSCDSPEMVIATVSGDLGLQVIDPSVGCVAARARLGAGIEGAALSPDGAVVFLGVKLPGFRNELIALDARTARELWRMPLGDGGSPNVLDGVGLVSGEVLSVSTDGDLLYLWRATSRGSEGITAINLRTRRPVAFSGPWNVAAGGVVPLVLGTAPGDRRLAVIASRQYDTASRSQEAIYLLDASSLVVVDSIMASEIGAGQGIWQVIPDPQGHGFYVAGSEQIVRYDLATRRVIARTVRLGLGALTLTYGGNVLVLTDTGTWPDSPGSGLLLLYGPNLESLGTIDISTPLGGAPHSASAISTGLAAPGRDERTVYVRAGSESLGPLYPMQPARLLVVDVVSRALLRTIDLGGFGLGFLFVSVR